MNGSNSNTSGSAVAAIDYIAGGENDKLSNAVLAEVVRRLVITLEAIEQGNILYSPTAPTDHTKVWFQTDPVTGIPLGQPKIWNESSQTWIPTTQIATYVPPRTRKGEMFSPQGASTQNFPFADIDTDDYIVILTPTTHIGGAWLPAPSAFPTHFGFTVINKTPTLVTVAFFGVPVGGIQWEVDLIERK